LPSKTYEESTMVSVLRTRRSAHVDLASVFALLALAAWLGGCERRGVESSSGAFATERVLWVSERVREAPCEVGGLTGTTRSLWILASTDPGRIFLAQLPWSSDTAPIDASLQGSTPIGHELPCASCPSRALRFPDGEIVVISVAPELGEIRSKRQTQVDSLFSVMSWRGTAGGSDWGEPVKLVQRSGRRVRLGAPIVTRSGKILLPAVWDSAGVALVLHESLDKGAHWREIVTLAWWDLGAPAVVENADGRLVLVAHRAGELVACESADGGISWNTWRALGIPAAASGIALARDEEGTLALAWTDPIPDSTQAVPPLQALRLAISVDAGRTWSTQQPLALRPGRIPNTPALLMDDEHLVVAFAERTAIPASHRIVSLAYARRDLQGPPRIESAHARYGIDPVAARASLRTLCAHTLARPEPARRLFVEGYFMRTLASAQDIFDSFEAETPEWFDARACGERALDWADSLVAAQDTTGYWATGYNSVHIADMAAALGVFPALEARAGAARAQRWEEAARRFVAALEQDGMILPSGAVGIGWPHSRHPRARQRESRAPYLVSTSLAGIEVNAWIARRSGDKRDRERALRSLKWTLEQVRADGALLPGPMTAEGREAALIGAAYTQEGWMAADLLLGGRDVRKELHAVLPRHVDWILRQQRPDGSWDSGASGEFARTPAIVVFLVWYDRRVEAREDVRAAIQRAGLRLADPQRWAATELFHAGLHYEVLRAHAGRALAAIGREGPVW